MTPSIFPNSDLRARRPLGLGLVLMSVLVSVSVLMLATLTSSAFAAVPVRTPVPDPRPLMLAALQASDGQAHGVLQGEIADAISKRFGATSPIYVDVTTMRRYAQAGCARLQVTLWQEGVNLPGASAPRKETVEFGINYCLDGRPPRSLD